MRAAARPRPSFGAELQEVVALILAEYRRFLLGGEAAEDGAAKAFGTRHTAGRAALAHLELALKLAGGGGTEDEDAARRVSDSIAEWRARMSTTPTAAPQEEPEAHDDDGSGA